MFVVSSFSLYSIPSLTTFPFSSISFFRVTLTVVLPVVISTFAIFWLAICFIKSVYGNTLSSCFFPELAVSSTTAKNIIAKTNIKTAMPNPLFFFIV